MSFKALLHNFVNAFLVILCQTKRHIKHPKAIPLIPLHDNEFVHKIFLRPFGHKKDTKQKI